jgi:hypothetical protein
MYIHSMYWDWEHATMVMCPKADIEPVYSPRVNCRKSGRSARELSKKWKARKKRKIVGNLNLCLDHYGGISGMTCCAATRCCGYNNIHSYWLNILKLTTRNSSCQLDFWRGFSIGIRRHVSCAHATIPLTCTTAAMFMNQIDISFVLFSATFG